MAAKTPDSIKRYLLGELSEIHAEFSTTNIDDGDTWASGISNIIGTPLFVPSNDPTTQASTGVHVANSSGTLTFYPGEDNATGTLIIRVRG